MAPAVARRIAVTLALLACAGCTPAGRDASGIAVREITPRFLLARAARDPALAADGRGRIALTWVTRDAAGADVWLAVSRDSGATFAEPVRLNAAPGAVVSFPEGRPMPALGPAGALAVVWCEKRGDSTGAVDVRLRASADFGHTLGDVRTLNDDAAGPPAGVGGWPRRQWLRDNDPGAFHGFPVIAFASDGALFAAWLDQRHWIRGPGEDEPRVTSLVASTSRDGGQTWSANVAVDDSACTCCRPDVAPGPDGALALAWRDASNDLRDPVLAVSRDGGRTFGSDTVVSRDRWRSNACPVAGPRLTWDGAGGGQFVWLTGADPKGCYIVPWRADGGAAGMRRAFTDSAGDARHALLATVGSSTLLGVESAAPGDSARRRLAVRALEPSGALGPWTALGADVSAGWMVGAGARRALASWVEREASTSRVRVAALTLATR